MSDFWTRRDPSTGQFREAKTRGGAFLGVRDTRPWWRRLLRLKGGSRG